MAVPVLRPTNACDEAFGGVTYHIQGELVPVLHIELGAVPVFFEHHILLWKDPAVQIGIKSLAGAFKRVLSGMPVYDGGARAGAHRFQPRWRWPCVWHPFAPRGKH
jgi:hypothetical protein